ncbi:MAG TPA: dehydratase [Thermoanaerobacterium sp.]|uniref:Dehydratase n=1 Tax=Desulfofundulus thermobenzoicus TaxID=29376 RepID=A0A6N7IUY8_9FIRM|nr:MaoC/PaaZ C-terminal domain-containing protein [Desulfofundulus thermobenzoicus]MQL53936.1 dehydratase [Desulfofundulus thermobenzoicus]HHV75643.1 dehydratase [Thermoanaerobacterium sp.]
MTGKYFDEWTVGEEWITPSRTMTETDVVMFAAMSGDYNELHTSKEYMKDSQFGERIVHGLLGLAVSHGLLFRLGLLEGTGIAFLGIESWQFRAPIFLNDTIHAKVKVLDKRPSRSKSDRGIVKILVQIIKQDDTIVQEGIKTLMIKRKKTDSRS